MKTQRRLIHPAPISTLGFLLILTTQLIGCSILSLGTRSTPSDVPRLTTFDAILLTSDDLPTRGLMQARPMEALSEGPRRGSDVVIGYAYQRMARRYRPPERVSDVVVGLEQEWSGGLIVRYWLWNPNAPALEKASVGTWPFASVPNFHPERNPEDIIGEATWRDILIYRRKSVTERGPMKHTILLFVKSNVEVYVMVDEVSVEHLQVARAVARKIEAKIEAALAKNGNTTPLKTP